MEIPLFCTSCQKNLEKGDAIYLCDFNKKPFCSNFCVESHYKKISDFFKNQIKIKKEKCTLNEVEFQEIVSDLDLSDKLFLNPDKISYSEDELGDSFYFYQKKFFSKKNNKSFWLFSICKVKEEAPSYILLISATDSKELIKKLEFEKTYKLHEVAPLDKELVEKIEQLKSEYLVTMLEEKPDGDIDFEHYHEYEVYFEETLEEADHIYLFDDDNKNEILNYSKGYLDEKEGFFYVILALKEGETIVPFFSFPTRDSNVYRAFQKGKLMHGKTKN